MEKERRREEKKLDGQDRKEVDAERPVSKKSAIASKQ
jgi:hypothetical protein